jgi:hypothetical protein
MGSEGADSVNALLTHQVCIEVFGDTAPVTNDGSDEVSAALQDEVSAYCFIFSITITITIPTPRTIAITIAITINVAGGST